MEHFPSLALGLEDLRCRFRSALGGRTSTLLHVASGSHPQNDFAAAIAAGLRSQPRQIPCRFLYDQTGSALYEQICVQPEYYPTRTEAAILARHARAIAALTGSVNLLELGAGSSVKTGLLLAAYLEAGSLPCYIPVDVSESALRQGQMQISRSLPQVTSVGLHGCYEDALPLLNILSPVMVIFLGSTIGNFAKAEAGAFLGNISGRMAEGDFFLLGLDLVKAPHLLEAAYNDAAGVTAAFTRNLFARMNRELGTALDLRTIEHQARYVAERQRIEIHARFHAAQTIRLQHPKESFDIAAGERVQTEISRKYQLEEISPWLANFGFATREIFTDDREWFALALLQKTGRVRSDRSV